MFGGGRNPDRFQQHRGDGFHLFLFVAGVEAQVIGLLERKKTRYVVTSKKKVSVRNDGKYIKRLFEK